MSNGFEPLDKPPTFIPIEVWKWCGNCRYCLKPSTGVCVNCRRKGKPYGEIEYKNWEPRTWWQRLFDRINSR